MFKNIERLQDYPMVQLFVSLGISVATGVTRIYRAPTMPQAVQRVLGFTIVSWTNAVPVGVSFVQE